MSSRYNNVTNVKDLEKALADVKKRRARSEKQLGTRYKKVQAFFSPISTAAGFIGGRSGEFMGGLYLASAFLRKFFNKKKKK